MKVAFPLLLSLLFVVEGQSQAPEFERFYPENSLYRKLQVKSVLDTIASPPNHHYKKEFDRLGRQTAWYYVEDSVRTYFKYEKKEDTLSRLHYYTANGRERPIYRREWFVYNEKGKIELYQSCQKNYGERIETSQCEMDKFYYDEKGRLLTRLSYAAPRYRQPFSVEMTLADTAMRLQSGLHYWYDKGDKLKAAAQLIGPPDFRSVDSFFYDSKGRLVKRTSYQKRGFLGELTMTDLTRIELKTYATNRLLETSFATYRDWMSDTLKATNPSIYEYIYFPNGLEKMYYWENGSVKRSLMNVKQYEFYRKQ